ncbi:hypothetical protein KAW55_03595 [bacterium]|nr:hypothetical protein [bacterium]
MLGKVREVGFSEKHYSAIPDLKTMQPYEKSSYGLCHNCSSQKLFGHESPKHQ